MLPAAGAFGPDATAPPGVVLETPGDANRTSAFLNIRVADIQASYQE